MKTNIFFFLMFIITSTIYTQDVIIKNDGEEWLVKVIELTGEEILFKEPGVDTVLYSIAISEVFMLKYEDGTKIVFQTAEEKKIDNLVNTESPDNMAPDVHGIRQQAVRDANVYYHGGAAPYVTGCLTLACCPVGLVYSALAASTYPTSGLNMPTGPGIYESPEYQKQYKQESSYIKRKNIWKVFGICVTINFAFSIISYAINPPY
ncbi:MAG: hypothetical protein ABIJ16_10920 [Bacteroidota bacterium]